MQAIAFFMSPRSYIRLACMTFLASVIVAYWAVFIPEVRPVVRRFPLLPKSTHAQATWVPVTALCTAGLHDRIHACQWT